MRKMCTTLAGIILVLGIICSIILAWNNGVVEDYDSYHGIEEKRSFLLTVMWFVCGIFVTVVEAVILNAIGEILENQEYIVKKISDVESKVAFVERKDKDENDLKYNGSWKCSECGRVNASYIGTCACGKSK